MPKSSHTSGIIKLKVLEEWHGEDRVTHDEFTLKQNVIKWEVGQYLKKQSLGGGPYASTISHYGEGLNIHLTVVGNTLPVVVCVDMTVDEMNELMKGFAND